MQPMFRFRCFKKCNSLQLETEQTNFGIKKVSVKDLQSFKKLIRQHQVDSSTVVGFDTCQQLKSADQFDPKQAVATIQNCSIQDHIIIMWPWKLWQPTQQQMLLLLESTWMRSEICVYMILLLLKATKMRFTKSSDKTLQLHCVIVTNCHQQ